MRKRTFVSHELCKSLYKLRRVSLWWPSTRSRGVPFEWINKKKTSYLFEMHCCVNYPGQKSSFPSQHTFIYAGPLVHCSRTDSIVRTTIIFKRIDRWLLRPQSSVGLCPTEYLRKAKLSEWGTKCRGKENGKGRNWCHVTSLMWTATAGDGS